MKVFAPAKVNLALTVLARERSGYHQIETLFCALDLCDELEVERGGEGIDLEVAGADVGPPEDNLVHRAARAFFEACGRPANARIRLRKRIPAGAGLGGGSSDAAATLAALNRIHDEPVPADRLLDIGAGLGSDVPFFLADAPLALAWGRGERLLGLPPLPRAPVLLAVPDDRVGTPEAYRALAERRPTDATSGPRIHRVAALRSWRDVAGAARNDFEPVVFERLPELADIKQSLVRTGARPALLTGSGSALFGVYPDPEARRRAVSDLRDRFPRLRLIETATTDVGEHASGRAAGAAATG